MAQPTAATGAARYIEGFEQATELHNKAVRDISRDALYDRGLPDLDRAVLGLTGSPKRLEQYHELDERLGLSIGRPIIIVTSVRDGRVETALGGVIRGRLLTEFGSPLSETLEPSDSPVIDSAKFHVPVLPVLSLQNYPGREPSVYVNGETSNFDRQTNTARLVIAQIRPNSRAQTTAGELPIFDWIEDGAFIDRPAIYGAKLFRNGISHLLAKIEEATT